jgi:Ca-activated chloride channel family protein
MARQRAVAVVALAALLSSPVLWAQRAAFSSRALAVRVDVLVTEGGKPVGGLTAKDFELRDNGVIQTLEVVDGADVPINTVLALDTSVSTRGKRQADLLAASEALVDGLEPGDRVALTTFSHAVTPRVRLTSDFPAVRSELRSLEPAGQTSVMDGAYAALTATLGEPGRSLVLVCTDGYDTWSWLRPEDVVDSARRSSVVIYAVTSTDARRETSLKSLADATGGHVMQVNSSRELRPAFEKILQEFRNRYVLAYSPAGVAADGYHSLDIRVKRSGASVKARPGYTGVAAPR